MIFEKGKTYYLETGERVAFDHAHDATAYVRPILTVYHEDEYERYEDEEVSGHLISVPMRKLLQKPPVHVLDMVISDKKKAIEEIEADKRKAISASREAIREVNAELAAAKADHERWMSEFSIFRDIGRVLDGNEIYPLHYRKSAYHRGHDVPIIPSLQRVNLLSVVASGAQSEKPWTFTKKGGGLDYRIACRIFHSETERAEFIFGLFDDACSKFRENPNYSVEGKTYTTRLDFGTLERWCKVHEHLAIPEDICSGKAEADAEIKRQKVEKLKADLQAAEQAAE